MSFVTENAGKVLFLVVLLLLFPTALFGEALSLKEAQRRAASDFPGVRVREAERHAAKAGIQEANALFMPRLSVSETYLRTDDPVSVFGGKLQQGKFAQTDFALPSLNNPSPINHWITRFEINQPVFQSGVDWAKRRGAVANYEAQGHLESFSRRGAKLAATKLYYTGVALERQIRALNDGIARLNEIDAAYEPAQAPTSATLTSLLVARSVRLGLEAMRERAEGERKKRLRDLNVLMGQDPQTPLTLTDPLPAVGSGTGFAEGRTTTREDVSASAAGVQGAESARDAALRRWGPKINAFGAYNIFTGDFTSSQDSYEAGLRLDWDVFDWSRRGAIQRSKADVSRAAANLSAARLQADAELEAARTDVGVADRTYRTLERAHRTAAEGLKVASERYQEGTLPLMDYSQTVQNWVQMRMRLNEGHLSSAVARAEYEFQKGGF